MDVCEEHKSLWNAGAALQSFLSVNHRICLTLVWSRRTEDGFGGRVHWPGGFGLC